jgi:hypothetical protein
MAVDFNLFLPLFFWICFSLQIHRSFFGLCLHLFRFRCLAASRRNGRVWVAAGWSPIRLVATAVGFCCRCPAAEGEAGLCAQRRRKGRPAGRGWEKCSGRLLWVLFENGGCRCGAALDYGEAGSARRGWAAAGRERRLRGAGFVLMRGRWDSVWGCWRRWEKEVVSGGWFRRMGCWVGRVEGNQELLGERRWDAPGECGDLKWRGGSLALWSWERQSQGPRGTAACVSKDLKSGRLRSFNLKGSTAAPGERKRVFRVRVFCVFFSQCVKLPPFWVCWGDRYL